LGIIAPRAWYAIASFRARRRAYSRLGRSELTIPELGRRPNGGSHVPWPPLAL